MRIHLVTIAFVLALPSCSDDGVYTPTNYNLDAGLDADMSVMACESKDELCDAGMDAP